MALFTLEALKGDDAIYPKGWGLLSAPDAGIAIDMNTVFQGPSTLLKHEMAYCLGQMKNTTALPIIESVLVNGQEDPMVRHEVGSLFFSHRRIYSASSVTVRRQPRQMVLFPEFPRLHLYLYSKNIRTVLYVRCERPARSRLRRSNGATLKRGNNITRAHPPSLGPLISAFSSLPSLPFSLQDLHLCRPCAPDFRPPCRQGWGCHGIRRRRATLQVVRHATAPVWALSCDVRAAEHWPSRRG